MYKNVKRCLIMLSFLAVFACSDKTPKANDANKEKIVQPKDTLDLLSENYISNAGSDAAKIVAEDLVEKGVPSEKEVKAVTAEEVEKPKKAQQNQPDKKASGKPIVSFESETHSFGRIMQGEEKEFRFKFKNTGNADLQIINATASCGCTVPSYPFIAIGPGEEGYIGVTYNSAGKLGPQKPIITVITNASPKTYKLHLEGIVDAERED